MRILLTLIAFGMIAAPALMMLARDDLPRGRRILRALLIFCAPALMLGFIQSVPELDGRALSHPNAWALARVALTGASLILPWCLYVWLMGPRR
ncbi:hypothetical protein [Bosea sp. TND4EK4]|uniref:hypothetical protein n=1 Tax=Bosea sp. TND4EK4 TaxID=1907408 RepID=UPI0009541E34|nr:hypothetical protein [Bosea sp. TND4EK4]SIP92683.1 hypothetical protein SAMN05880592_101202 [Bosea sp. TND4EK4]